MEKQLHRQPFSTLIGVASSATCSVKPPALIKLWLGEQDGGRDGLQMPEGQLQSKRRVGTNKLHTREQATCRAVSGWQ